VCAHWGIEAFEAYFADVLEQKSFAEAQFGDCIRDKDLFRLRVSAEARSELNCRSKQIVVLLNGFADCGADSNLERVLGIFLRVLFQFALDLNRASHCSCCRNEGGHNPVAGMLNLASTKSGQRIAHDRVMDAKYYKRRFVSQQLGQGR
jgi:hypothetical protein